MTSKRSGRLLRINAVAVLVVLLLAACGSGTGMQPSVSPAARSAVSPSPTPTPRTQAEEDCSQTVPATVKISDLALKAADGVTLRAAAVGSGQRGVILLHQTDNGLCGWLP